MAKCDFISKSILICDLEYDDHKIKKRQLDARIQQPQSINSFQKCQAMTKNIFFIIQQIDLLLQQHI